MLNYRPEKLHECIPKLAERMPLELGGALMTYCYKMAMEGRAHPTLAHRYARCTVLSESCIRDPSLQMNNYS